MKLIKTLNAGNFLFTSDGPRRSEIGNKSMILGGGLVGLPGVGWGSRVSVLSNIKLGTLPDTNMC